ncbi:MAG: endolytic transglycosylase MltG [bacterium]
MKPLQKIIIYSLLIIGLFSGYFWQGIYLPQKVKAEAKYFKIAKGESVWQISERLEEENLIKHQVFFEFYVVCQNKARQLKAGEYLLSPEMNIPEITKALFNGNGKEKKITIIEGWNLKDLGWYFTDTGMFSTEELFEVTGSPAVICTDSENLLKPRDFSDQFTLLKDKPKNISLEGYLFPDTYYFSQGTSREEIVEMMLENLDHKFSTELREEVASQQKSIFETITMASLLEKEVKTLEDKKIVAGLLWKRLENNIPLQVDATVIYLTGKKTSNVPLTDTEIDSLYNTYQYRGLPAGPICNPGLESIVAAVYPEDSPYWYYLSTPEGKTIFSKTLAEHNIAKAKYLK